LYQLPALDGAAVPLRVFLIQRLGQQVGTLKLGVNSMDANRSLNNLLTEVMVLDIQVLGARTILVFRRHDQGATVVFKDSAVDFGLGFCDIESVDLKLLDELHQGHALAKVGAQSDVFCLCR
jgi:hypothetical protein